MVDIFIDQEAPIDQPKCDAPFLLGGRSQTTFTREGG